jgi:hypothetical protein
MKVRILLSGEDELSLAQNRYIFSSAQQFIGNPDVLLAMLM